MKLLLIDGHYYVYRSFFAIQNLSNSKGEPTNAIFGFTKTLRLMLKHLKPDLGAVFWDEGLPQKRLELQPAYKETRKEMPQPMVPQLEFIQETLTELLGFKNVSMPDTEADDFMGCYAIAACKRKMEVVLATNDKDLYQLVGPCVKVYSTAKADLLSPKDGFALLGEAEVTKKWEVPPKFIGDVLALTGDSVDNIPGAGFGRKTAAKLIMEHGGLDNLLQNVAKVKGKSQEKLAAAREQILQNRKMVALECDMKLPVPLEELQIRPNYPGLIAALEKCEFKSLLQEVKDEAAKAGTSVQSELSL